MTTQSASVPAIDVEIPEVFTNKQRSSAKPSRADICALLNIHGLFPKKGTDLLLTGKSSADTYYDAMVNVIADELFVKPKLCPGYHTPGQVNTFFIRNNENGLVSPIRRVGDAMPMSMNLKSIFDGKLQGEDLEMPKEWKSYIDRILPVLIADAKDVQKKRDDAAKNAQANASQTHQAGGSANAAIAMQQTAVAAAHPQIAEYKIAIMDHTVKISAKALETELKGKMDWEMEDEEDADPK